LFSIPKYDHCVSAAGSPSVFRWKYVLCWVKKKRLDTRHCD
jgi:hypothetical protein